MPILQFWSKLSRLPPVTPTFSTLLEKPTHKSVSGTTGSYQKWASYVGDQTYTFNNILPYFKKSPQFTPPDYSKRGIGSKILYDTDSFSLDGGPLQVSYSNFYHPISSSTKRAFLNLGLQNLKGLNSGSLIGFSEPTLTIDPQVGTRSSSETSFLQDTIATSTLKVYQKTLAQKIIFGEKKTATGVEVVTAGREYTLCATKDVILAAGVVCLIA
jgi:choline dehydrogenase